MFGFDRFSGSSPLARLLDKISMPAPTRHERLMLKVAQEHFEKLGEPASVFFTEETGRIAQRLKWYLDSAGIAGDRWKASFRKAGGFEAEARRRIRNAHLSAVRICVEEVEMGKSAAVYATLAGMHLDNTGISRMDHQVNGMPFSQWKKEADFRENDGGRIGARGRSLLLAQSVIPLASFRKNRFQQEKPT